jgi:hypothetical protein
MIVPALLLAIAAAGGLAWLYRRHRERLKAQRARLFDAVLPLLDSYRVTQDGVVHPVLDGRYRGHAVRLEPIIDQVAVRKLPSLWLLTTVFGPIPYRGAIDVLARPQNTEFYSPSALLDHAVAPPPGWPVHAQIRSDDPAAMPPQQRLTPHVAMFDDPRVKELVVTPRGVRIVYQIGQAERGHYLVLRQAQFDEQPLSATLAQGLLDRAIAIHRDLAGTPVDDPPSEPSGG